mmetsp:Transcript_21149/g.38437  ORF Transcript_21149/g.38437 Transcript_21149/m.38437 type:complete len:443 (+) Transcript_21149:82-1410(+)
MRSLAFVLVCLCCAGSGHRWQNSLEPAQGSSNAERPQSALSVLATLLLAPGSAAGWHASGASSSFAVQNPSSLRPAASRGDVSMQATLYDMPVSNNGARARLIIYAKGLDASGAVKVEPPSELGGLKSPEYTALNPQGKMPLLVAPDITLFESDTIARYLIDAYADAKPSFVPATAVARALDNQIARVHDVYVAAIQACMYKATPPFGIYQSRWEALAELKKQLGVIENLAVADGPFLTGSEIGNSDAALFPTMIFMRDMLPRFMQPGWEWKEEEAFGPKLLAWWKHMTSGAVPAATRVFDEIQGSLNKWDERGRYDDILLAGRKDTADATIFDKIIAKEIPSEVVYEDSRCLVFKDIAPAAPVHLLVIPKRREGLTQLRHSVQDHEYILGHLLRIAGEQGKAACGDGGFRIVINDGAEAAQSVFHLHVHVLGGREMTWPPG